MQMFSMDPLVAIASLLCVLVALGAGYRRFLHPLSKYPGPFLASITEWYQVYFDLYLGGELLEQTGKLHHAYGPVIRIGPNELQFSIASAYWDIYSIGSKFQKDPAFYNALGVPESSIGLIDRNSAKERRDIINPLFSRRAILKLEDVVHTQVNRLVSQLTVRGTEPVNMYFAFRCLTIDVISSYCLAVSVNALGAPDFKHPLLVGIHQNIPIQPFLRWFPVLGWLVNHVPDSFITRLVPDAHALFSLRRMLSSQVQNILKNPEESLRVAEHEIIYHHLLSPQRRSIAPLSAKSLAQEAEVLISAGSDTTGGACTVGCFRVLNDPSVHKKLLEELTTYWPDTGIPISLERLEKLPYLTAVIKESLRLSYGAAKPLPRIVGPGDAVIAGFHVPSGTVVSMGPVPMHQNLEVFPDPLKFSPERWITDDAEHASQMDAHLVSFSRGPRMCPGLNLAWCELYLIFANIFRKLDLTIHDTTIDDFKFKEYFTPYYPGKQFHATVQPKSMLE